MSLISRAIDIPLFLHIEEDSLLQINEILESHNLSFRKFFLLSGPETYRVAGEKVAENLKEKNFEVIYAEITNSSIETVEEIRGNIRKVRPDAVLGVGGGRVIDVGKYSAYLEKINFISIPTTVANDGISSPVAVINFSEEKRSIITKMPLGVIADLNVIKSAPLRTIKAGIADLLSNIQAVKDWELARDVKGDEFDEFATLLSSRAAESVLSSDNEDILENDFLDTLVGSLTLGGISMGIAGSSKPCSGAAHKFSHALDRMGAGSGLHGEQVGLGFLLATYLRGDNWKFFVSLFKKWGIPGTAEELSLKKEEVTEGLIKAKEIRPERYTILEHIDIQRDKVEEAARNTGII